jgi:hypothetical protein
MSSTPLNDDLILPECYDDWKIDDPIWVWNDRQEAWPIARHFAGVNENGQVLAWRSGATSHSAYKYSPLPWPHASKTDPRGTK